MPTVEKLNCCYAVIYPGRLKIALFYKKECAIFNRGYDNNEEETII